MAGILKSLTNPLGGVPARCDIEHAPIRFGVLHNGDGLALHPQHRSSMRAFATVAPASPTCEHARYGHLH